MAKGNRGLSRREWLRSAGAAGLSSLLVSQAPFGKVGSADAAEESHALTVPTRPFGKTGVEVSCLSLGGIIDVTENQLLLKQALKYGVTYWDTADCYVSGKSEEGMGKFFSKYPEARKQVFLVSKSDDRDPEGMAKLLKRSLERMKTDYIDLYFIHGLSDIGELNAETRRWVERAKAEGKIKLFGFSTHKNMEKCMTAAAKLGWIDGIMVSYNFRLMDTKNMQAAVDACVQAGIGLTAMKTQGGGPVRAESETELRLAGRFLKQGFTDKQAKLMAVWENPHIASICSQMPDMTILMSNVAAALKRTKLSSVDRQLMEKYAWETNSSYCAGCAHICEAAVGGQVPISDVMRCLMYHRTYGDHQRAKELFSTLPKGACDLTKTLDFSPAEQACPQGLKIGKLMKEATELLNGRRT